MRRAHPGLKFALMRTEVTRNVPGEGPVAAQTVSSIWKEWAIRRLSLTLTVHFAGVMLVFMEKCRFMLACTSLYL